jgi:hypothetical protein
MNNDRMIMLLVPRYTLYFLVIAVTNHNHAECPQDNITVLNIKIIDIDKS